MTWSRQDDGAESNPRVLRLEEGGYMRKALGYGDPFLQRGAAWGFLMLLAAWSGRHHTDLHFPEFIVRRVVGIHEEWFVKACQAAGLLSRKKVRGREGDVGWQFLDNGDELVHVLSKEQVEQNRHRHASRRNGIQVAVRLRDGDVCRYRGEAVNFKAKTGWMRGTYDHVDPADPDRLVVACGGCNQEKGRRTPEEWGVPLRDVPEHPLYNPDTLELFERHGIRPEDIPERRAHALARLGSGAAPGLVPDLVPEPGRLGAPDRSMAFLASAGSGRQQGQDGPGQDAPVLDLSSRLSAGESHLEGA